MTDLRLEPRPDNLRRRDEPFVAGAIEASGRICWSVDKAIEALRELR